jgi:hypothetical protein
VLVAAGGIGVAVAVVPQAITATRRKTTTPNPKVFDGSKPYCATLQPLIVSEIKKLG